MQPSTTLFFDVDTQRDFILPDGALRARDAERILPALAAVTALGRRIGARMSGSVDRHFPGDPELARSGGRYPDHCMDGTAGQRKVDATAPRAPVWIENREYRPGALEALLAGPGEIMIEKQRLDVLEGNRNARAVLDHALRGVADVVVYGVVTDVCVDLTVAALRRWPVRQHVVIDAIAPFDPRAAAAAMERWRRWGVDLITVAQLARAFPE